jgi:hypothetical protein
MFGKQRRRRPGLAGWQDFDTRALHEIGMAALEIALPGALAAAEEAQEDGFDSEKKEELLEIVSGLQPDAQGNRRPGGDTLDVSDYYSDPWSVGQELVYELEMRGFTLVRKR